VLKRLFVVCLFVCGCREEGFFEPDLSHEEADFGEGGDMAIPADFAPPPPDLRGFDGPPEPVLSPGASDRFLIAGTMLTPGGPLTGELLVEGNSITCVDVSCSLQPGAAGATVIRTQGLVIPGLLDPHNHGLFDIFDETDWTPTKLYTNHSQWTAESRYKEMVNAKQYLNGEQGSPVDVGCEMDKYGEVKALVGATTSILMAPGTSRSCYASLARTIDTSQNDLGQDKIQTSISVPASSTAQPVCNNLAMGTTNAYVIHVGEGIDSTAKGEFAKLAAVPAAPSPGPVGCLLGPQTTIVHGTAFDATEFTQMAAKGMRLVWSPKSNVFLYGATAKIDVAIASGVQTIALGPDWSLGGSVNMLDELAFAAAWDDNHLGNVLTNERLFRMVTIDAAKALGVDNLLGSLEVGKRADLAIVGGDPGDPYGSIIRLRPNAVQMVMVDGRFLYGDAPLVAAGPTAPGCETITVCGTSKFLCAAETSTSNLLNETFAQIVSTLQTTLTNYDTSQQPNGIAPFMPLAPLAKCP
jgi:hypothetical protein